MLMYLLKRSTIALAIAMMLTNLATSPHPKLFSSFFNIILALVCFVVVSS